MNIKKIIKEEVGDFDWAKETNPIQCKDLKGYYFYYGTDPRKFIIGDVLYHLGDVLKVRYKWYDQHSNKDDWGKMGCDTLIHRVKLGSYNLYDTDDKEVNQRDLVYTNNTFDDDVRKEIWEQGEIDWINDTNPYLFDKDEEWILVNDVDANSIEESKEIQKYLITLGYTWSGGKTDLADYKIYTIHHFTSSSLRGFMTFYSNSEGEVGLANSDIEKGKYDKLLYWSDIKSNDITLK